MIGHTSVVNCLARGGHYKDDEYIVSSSENGYALRHILNQFYKFLKFIRLI